MARAAFDTRIRRLRPMALGLVVLLAVEALLVVGYVARPNVRPTLLPLYPFIWINAGLLAVLTTVPPSADRRRRLVGAGIAVGYFVVLAYFGGLFGAGAGTTPLQVKLTPPPGFAPMLVYDGELVRMVLEPYKVVGYLSLAYLVYVTVLDAAGAALSGVVGLFSCVSCTWPIVGTVAAGVFGGSSALATAALEQAYPLSTLVFLSAVALLWWRPSFGGGG